MIYIHFLYAFVVVDIDNIVDTYIHMFDFRHIFPTIIYNIYNKNYYNYYNYY